MQIFDDYGHHPVEIAAVLRAARASTKGKVVAVMQPHRYTRLQSLFDSFATCFNDADVVIIADVYAAGEQPIDGVDRDALVNAIRAHGHRRAMGLPSPEVLPAMVREIVDAGRLRRVPRRRQHHAMGLCAARAACGGRAGMTTLQKFAHRADERRDAAIQSHIAALDCFATLAIAGRRAYDFPRSLRRHRTELMPELRGKLSVNEPLAPYTWFRVGGPAQIALHAGGRSGPRLFPRAPAEGHPCHRHRSRLQSHRARRRR